MEQRVGVVRVKSESLARVHNKVVSVIVVNDDASKRLKKSSFRMGKIFFWVPILSHVYNYLTFYYVKTFKLELVYQT